MRTAFTSLVLVSLVLPAVAFAAPSHFDVRVKPRVDRRGAVCGATITCVVRSDNAAFPVASVGLLPAAKIPGMRSDDALHSLGRVAVQAPTNHNVPATIELDYATSRVKSGDKMHLVSAWTWGRYTHTFGAGTESLITLP